MNSITKIAVFASGSGSNAENLIRFFQNHSDIEISLVLSNKSKAYVLTRARNLGVREAVFSRADFTSEDTNNPVADFLKSEQIDFIVLAGFLAKIPASLIRQYPERIINIHPSLLPSYGGKGMYGHHVHNAVIAAKEQFSGITIHLVNEAYDEGRILFQDRCVVSSDDTAETLAQKIHQLEHENFPLVVAQYIKSTLK